MRLLAILIVTFATASVLADPTVFEVRKPFPMSDKDAPLKDYYINAGSDQGLQAGMVITAVRKIPLYDSYQSRSAGDLTVPVAKLRIIHVQQGLSVARFEGEIVRRDTPILEDNFIMLGDQLDLSTATHGKKSAQNDGDGETPTTGTETAPAPPVPAAAPHVAPATPAASIDVTPIPVPPPAEVTSQKVENSAQNPSPKDNSPGVKPVDGPTIR